MTYSAIVTGGSDGIGKAIVKKLIENGFRVAAIARNSKKFDTLRAELGKNEKNLDTYLCDVTDKKALLNTIDKIKKTMPTINILVNNAGVFIPGQLATEEEGIYELTMKTNMDAAYYVTRAVLNQLNKDAYIFNICSTASITPYINGGSYCISKYALLGFTKVLREELKGNIAVSAVLPGATLTNSWSGTEEKKERFMRPEDVAEVIWTAWKIRAYSVMEEILLRPILGDF